MSLFALFWSRWIFCRCSLFRTQVKSWAEARPSSVEQGAAPHQTVMGLFGQRTAAKARKGVGVQLNSSSQEVFPWETQNETWISPFGGCHHLSQAWDEPSVLSFYSHKHLYKGTLRGFSLGRSQARPRWRTLAGVVYLSFREGFPWFWWSDTRLFCSHLTPNDLMS